MAGIGAAALLAAGLAAAVAGTGVAATAADGQLAGVAEMSLEECLQMARAKNRRGQVSSLAVAVAEAQHRQALAAYWPQASLRAGYERIDQPFNFVFPASGVASPAQSVTVPGGAAQVTIPANAFAPGFPPAAIQLPISYPGQSFTSPPQTFPIPAQNIKVLDPNVLSTSMNLNWLLYDGGMRKGLREQSRGQVDAARQEVRRTDLEIAEGVTRLYWGAVLSRQVRQLGEDTLSRMEATLALTEAVYKEGAGKVTRADYLENKVVVESLRAAVALLAKNEQAAEAALAYTVGLPWSATIRPSAGEIPFRPYAGDLNELVGSAYQFNPDWAALEAGVRALEGAVRTAQSGHHPRIGLTGNLRRWWNDFDGGIATAQNKAGWTVGAGLELPLFDGNLTRNKVSEARARLERLQQQGFLLKEGIGLEVRDLFLGLNAAVKSYRATGAAMKAAQENRELNTRAYQNELVETEKVIRAQLMEAFMSAQHYRARYDHATLQARLDLVVGREVQGHFGAVSGEGGGRPSREP